MELIKYEIKKGDTLELIAEREGISVKDLVSYHNNHCGLTNMIIGVDIPLQLNFLLLKKNREKTEKLENEIVDFENKARYRCEQINISRINNEIITLSATTYLEYLLKQDIKNKNIFKVDLKDNSFSVDPSIYKQGFDFTMKLEKLRTPVTLKINSSGVAEKIYNPDELLARWENFRDNDLKKDPVFNQLLSQAPDQAKDLVTTANNEFSSMDDFAKTLDKNLFFHIIFRAFQGNNVQDYELSQMSQIFPHVILKTHIVKSIVKEDEDFAVYRLVGTLDKSNISHESLEKMYDEIYKPMIKYGYTEFDFIYRINYTIDKKSGFITEGRAAISEKIKNNYEIVTEYNIKKVEL